MPSSTARDTAHRRSTHAVRLRAMSWSYQQIADATLPCPDHQPLGDPTCLIAGMGCAPMFTHRSSARKAIQKALAQEYAAGKDTREELRRQQLVQIDTLLQTAMEDATAEMPEVADLARGGDPKAAFIRAAALADQRYKAMTAATRLLDRRAKLLGLDAPTRVAVTSELDAQIEALVEELTGVPASHNV